MGMKQQEAKVRQGSLEVEMVELQRLRAAPYNPRRMSVGELDKLK